MVARELGRLLSVRSESDRQRPEKSEVLQLVCSAEKAWRKMGWRAEVTLEEGLARTVVWIDSHRDIYRTNRYTI